LTPLASCDRTDATLNWKQVEIEALCEMAPNPLWEAEHGHNRKKTKYDHVDRAVLAQ
jgi:hypothetical protein